MEIGELNQQNSYWNKLSSLLTKPKKTEVDNQRIENLVKKGFLFGFSGLDIFIVLAAILALLFLQIKPYLIPYLEQNLFGDQQNYKFKPDSLPTKVATSSSHLKISNSSESGALSSGAAEEKIILPSSVSQIGDLSPRL